MYKFYEPESDSSCDCCCKRRKIVCPNRRLVLNCTVDDGTVEKVDYSVLPTRDSDRVGDYNGVFCYRGTCTVEDTFIDITSNYDISDSIEESLYTTVGNVSDVNSLESIPQFIDFDSGAADLPTVLLNGVTKRHYYRITILLDDREECRRSYLLIVDLLYELKVLTRLSYDGFAKQDYPAPASYTYYMVNGQGFELAQPFERHAKIFEYRTPEEACLNANIFRPNESHVHLWRIFDGKRYDHIGVCFGDATLVDKVDEKPGSTSMVCYQAGKNPLNTDELCSQIVTLYRTGSVNDAAGGFHVFEKSVVDIPSDGPLGEYTLRYPASSPREFWGKRFFGVDLCGFPEEGEEKPLPPGYYYFLKGWEIDGMGVAYGCVEYRIPNSYQRLAVKAYDQGNKPVYSKATAAEAMQNAVEYILGPDQDTFTKIFDLDFDYPFDSIEWNNQYVSNSPGYPALFSTSNTNVVLGITQVTGFFEYFLINAKGKIGTEVVSDQYLYVGVKKEIIQDITTLKNVTGAYSFGAQVSLYNETQFAKSRCCLTSNLYGFDIIPHTSTSLGASTVLVPVTKIYSKKSYTIAWSNVSASTLASSYTVTGTLLGISSSVVIPANASSGSITFAGITSVFQGNTYAELVFNIPASTSFSPRLQNFTSSIGVNCNLVNNFVGTALGSGTAQPDGGVYFTSADNTVYNILLNNRGYELSDVDREAKYGKTFITFHGQFVGRTATGAGLTGSVAPGYPAGEYYIGFIGYSYGTDYSTYLEIKKDMTCVLNGNTMFRVRSTSGQTCKIWRIKYLTNW